MAATAAGEESLEFLSSAFPPLYLNPSPELSRHARDASRHLFSSLIAFVPPKHQKLDRLLADEGFDAEQIWAQIDLVARPILPPLRKELGRIAELGPSRPPPVVETIDEEKVGEDEEEEEEEEVNEDGREDDDDDDEDDNVDDDDVDDDDDEGEGKGYEGVEDRFLKMEELEKYMEDGEAREYEGLTGKGKKKDDEDGDDESEGEDEKEDIDLEFGHLGSGDDEELAENARYSDYFKSNKVRGSKKYDHEKKNKASKEELEFHSGSEDLELEDEEKDESDVDIQDNGTRSTHEKQLLRIQSKVEQMEKENLEPKSWFMQGEVTAAKRPKDSLLVMDLDFEHNVKPPPVDTVEMLASLEDLMRKRIIEGQFDDVQRAPALLSKPPKELKELDESKSKKGLAELYEEDYSQKTGLVSAPLSSSDKEKKEATVLFKQLCTKLDALAHFHYAPKPVIEDMSIQANVPALAMEEIAPLAVSDAAMLAPEEVFKGKGDVKEEAELTQEDRKRRRANKKRKFKAETAKKGVKKMRQNAAPTPSNGKEDL